MGYTKEEIIGKNWFDTFVPARDRDRVKAGFVKLIAGKMEPIEYFENPVLSRNGEERLIAWHNTVLRNRQGDIIATLSSGEDVTESKRAKEALRVAQEELERHVEERTAELITANEQLRQEIQERKRIEEALRNSERRLADIINFLPDATFAIDGEGRVIAWNRAMEEMTGLKAGAIVGKGNSEYAVPFYGERRPMLADLVLRPDQAREGQYTFVERHQDTLVAETFLPSLRGGTHLWGKARLLYDSQGKVSGAIESMRDITALKRAAHALRESEQRYRNIIENAVEGIFQATADGRYLSVNPAFARMCGYSSPEEMMKEVTDIAHQLYVHPHDRTRIKRLYDDPGFVKGFEAQFRCKDGGLIWVSITARSVRDESGALLHYEGTIEDITERKRAEIEVQNHQEQLRLLASELSVTEERERRRLATDLHDSIGQTLAMSKVKLDALRSQAISAVLAKDLDDICTLLDRALEDTRSLTFELSPPVLYELGIEAALESLVERMQQVHGIKMKLSVRGRPRPLSEDTAVFCFRAVQELLVNAVKHARARKVRVSIGRDRDWISIMVADDGTGFDASEAFMREGGKKGFGPSLTVRRGFSS